VFTDYLGHDWREGALTWIHWPGYAAGQKRILLSVGRYQETPNSSAAGSWQGMFARCDESEKELGDMDRHVTDKQLIKLVFVPALMKVNLFVLIFSCVLLPPCYFRHRVTSAVLLPPSSSFFRGNVCL